MSLKENLKKYRKAAHLTLFEASGAVGVSISTLQRYEKGSITHIPYQNLRKLAQLYHTTIGELYGSKDNNTFPLPIFEKRGYQNTGTRERLCHYSDLLGAEDTTWILKKYQALDPQGKHLISTLLDAEYQRCIGCEKM